MSAALPRDAARQERAAVAGVAAGRSAASAAAGYLDRMAAMLRSRASVAAVFGVPVTGAGVTIVPAARVRLVMGGGLGTSDQVGEGGGGGAIVSAVPAGYLELKDGAATYHPIRRPLADVLRPAAVVLAATLARRLARRRG